MSGHGRQQGFSARWWSRAVQSFCALSIVLLAACANPGSDPGKFPNRLIELIVPWAPGGGTDRVARFVADELQRKLGQPVVVVNRTGGSGAVGHSAGALAPADGYVLTMATFELSTMKTMQISQLTWRDFEPVAQLNGDAAAILVKKDARWNTLPELLETIRKERGKIKMSGTATGGAWDLARSGLLLAAGIPPSDVIWSPTQGAAPALVELLGGHVDVVCTSVPEAAAQLESGQARVLAVLGPKRLAEYPDYPTAQEQGIDYEGVGWRGIMAPRGTPSPIVQKLGEALVEITSSETFRAFMKKNGFAIQARGPAEFAKFLEAQEAKWTGVIRSAGYEALGKNSDPGPRLLPIVLGILLVLGLVGDLAFSGRGSGTEAEPGKRAGFALPANGIFLLVALGLYLILMPRIGFLAGTIGFATGIMWKLGTRPWLAATVSAALAGAIYVLFQMIFKVQLP